MATNQVDAKVLAIKRKRKQEDRLDPTLRKHLDSLGLKSADEYKTWCAENGFSRRLSKSPFDRRRERIALVDRSPSRATLSLKHARLPHAEMVTGILSGKIRRNDVREKHHQTLCEAIIRLENLEPDRRSVALENFKRIHQVCEQRRVKFIANSRPGASSSALRSCSFVEALASVASFSDQWIRQPEEWKFRTHNQKRQFDSLLTHLLAAHPVPRFFYSVWFRPDLEKGLKEQSAFVHVAAGHSIRQVSLPIEYTRRMSHHFLRAPQDASFAEALRWGQVLGMSGDPPLARAVLGCFLRDNFENEAFWKTVIQWFIDHPKFDRYLFGAVADFLNNQKFGLGNPVRINIQAREQGVETVEPAQQPNLQMKGRTPAALLRDVNCWHRQLQMVGRNSALRWRHSGIQEFQLVEGERAQSVWTIRQILGSEMLTQEGSQMKHCVGSYARSCYQGQTSIWTMRLTKKQATDRVLTIEVIPTSRVICQAKGRANRAPKEHELNILRRWAQAADLKLASYL